MARIRTIKPEFPQSESMGRLSRDARLLFIMLWTIADDSGKARASSRMLASLLFPYDDDAPALIDGWLMELDAESCIARYKIEGSTYLQICNWLIHQKIDKPSTSRFPEFDESSRILANPRESSSVDLVPRTVDLGPVPMTLDLPLSALPTATPSAVSTAKPPRAKKNEPAKKELPDTTETWDRYSKAYQDRYGVPAQRNGKVNGQMAQFCRRVAVSEAPAIAAFYVAHNNAFYVAKGHAVGQLLADAEKLRTEWATNQTITQTQAQQADKTQANGTVWGKVIAGIEERERNAAIN
jgi:hypothetical protein